MVARNNRLWHVLTEDIGQPIARISASPASGSAPLTVVFSASGSDPRSGASIVGYRWDWTGDGTTDAVTAGPDASHTYDEPGPYLAAVRVVNDLGEISSPAYVRVDATDSPPYLSADHLWLYEDYTDDDLTWPSRSGDIDASTGATGWTVRTVDGVSGVSHNDAAGSRSVAIAPQFAASALGALGADGAGYSGVFVTRMQSGVQGECLAGIAFRWWQVAWQMRLGFDNAYNTGQVLTVGLTDTWVVVGVTVSQNGAVNRRAFTYAPVAGTTTNGITVESHSINVKQSAKLCYHNMLAYWRRELTDDELRAAMDAAAVDRLGLPEGTIP